MNHLGGTWFTAIDDRYKTYKYVYNFVSDKGKHNYRVYEWLAITSIQCGLV